VLRTPTTSTSLSWSILFVKGFWLVRGVLVEPGKHVQANPLAVPDVCFGPNRLHTNRKVKTLDVAENIVDWEIANDGLYVATRNFLIRRGYCCANRCRNCPYINWRQQRDWQPLPIECLRRRCVKPKVIAGARELLCQHKQQLQQCNAKERDYHRRMIAYYNHLLETWESY
jgi:hypothetical protein